MDSRTREVNRVVKGYDYDLVAQRERNGAIHIYRKTHRPADPLHMVMALTDTWNVHGKPRDWGLQVISNRLAAHDLWKDETIVDRVEAAQLKAIEDQDKHRQNTVESFLYDFRRQFSKATNDINTGSLAKLDKRAL